ncbi:hypothetical protein RIR_jg40159.t1 [Rhizophagus irregularis DAOM 181602=DAOM 197198]|nr:hypothetical protein RIR_jg40159.t1 [Rhizophagus irregularis DAOM 181602=DAOM 197198]
MSSNYEDNNIIKITRTKMSSTYEDSNIIKITRTKMTKMSSNYEDSNIIKITRTKMVSNLQAQITSITISSNYEQYHQNYENHNFKISQNLQE